MKRHPPRMAVRLLGYFTSDEALVGDLVEEVARGRSACWCWRQVAAAVPAGAWRDICRHSGLAFRALIVGWVLLGVAGNRGGSGEGPRAEDERFSRGFVWPFFFLYRV